MISEPHQCASQTDKDTANDFLKVRDFLTADTAATGELYALFYHHATYT